MCGIAGFVTTASVEPTRAYRATSSMVCQMRRRGPDAEGLWASPGVILGHRRLAILDLDPRSNQPMLSADGRYAIVFNGEIYNYQDLRRSLQSDGAIFRTTSDTEVLLEMFARHGADMLPRLRGMFAFAIWDTVRRELFLARDPYGIKPLYYARTKEGVLFASQVKALLASGLVESDMEPAGVAGFYLWGSVPEPWTLYKNVLGVPAGHSMVVREDGSERPVCWWDIRRCWQERGPASVNGDLAARVREQLTDSVRAHLVADVPVSVFLSGGVDSAVVAALASQLGAPVEGITLGFEEYAGHRTDEVPVAAAIAAHYGLRHFVRRVTAREFQDEIPNILSAMDQPSIDGVNTWFASKAAAERGYKVALSGVGGDELFCGYSTFVQVPRMAAVGRAIGAIPGVRSVLGGSVDLFARNILHPKIAGLPRLTGSFEDAYLLSRGLFLPRELPSIIGEEVAREGLARLGGSLAGLASAEARSDAATVGMLESSLYLRNQLLRDSDWASMHHSVELRTPMVDAYLLESLGSQVSGFVSGVGKAMVSRSPTKPLPDLVIQRPKVGFSIPVGEWLLAGTKNDTTMDPILPLARGEPWARRWAVTLMNGLSACA